MQSFFHLAKARLTVKSQADQVFEQGHWEYRYLYREAPGAFEYASLKFGAWMLELQSRLKAKISGSNKASVLFSESKQTNTEIL